MDCEDFLLLNKKCLTRKDLKELKKKQSLMNNTTTDMKNTLEGINSRITEAEEEISDLEDEIVEITTAETEKDKRRKMKRK